MSSTNSRSGRHSKQTRQDRLEQLHERLVDEVRKIRTGDDWRAWLDTAAKFHHYSFRNVLLIAAQRPDATVVAGYTTWKKLGRQVNKGERGIAILAPVLSRRQTQTTTPVPAEDVEHGSRAESGSSNTGRDGDSVERHDTGHDPSADRTASSASSESASSESASGAGGRLVGVRPAYVWDVTQTSGDPLPSPPTPAELTGDAPAGMWDALAVQVEKAGFTLHRETITAAGHSGYTNYTDRRVVVAERLAPADAAVTLAHEVAHIVMHDAADFTQWTTRSCRGIREVEAESVAYLISAHHGLASDSATFPYVATWATQADPDQGPNNFGRDEPDRIVQDTGQRVMATARDLIDAMTANRDEPHEYTSASTDMAATHDTGVRPAATPSHAPPPITTRTRSAVSAVALPPDVPASGPTVDW